MQLRKLQISYNDMSEETFQPIHAHPGYYISNQGRVRKNTKTFPALFTLPSGAVIVDIRVEGVSRRYRVARLVYAAFLGNCEGFDVLHKDGDKTNCKAENLYKSARADRGKK